MLDNQSNEMYLSFDIASWRVICAIVAINVDIRATRIRGGGTRFSLSFDTSFRIFISHISDKYDFQKHTLIRFSCILFIFYVLNARCL